MSETFMLYLLAGCVLGLVAWPVYSFARGSMDLAGLVVCISIPLLVVVVMAVGSSPARAQTSGIRIQTPPASQIAGPYSSWFPPGQTGFVLDRPPSVTPVSGSAGGSVNVGAGGTAVITRPNGPNINVPVGVNSKIPAATAAAAAARTASIARGLAGPLGTAWLAWDIYNRVKESGVHTCPPPDFFCFPPTTEFDREKGRWRIGLSGEEGTISELTAILLAKHCIGCTVVSETHKTITGVPSVDWRLKFPGNGDSYLERTAQYVDGELTQKEIPGPAMDDSTIASKMATKAASDSSGTAAANMYKAAVDADAKMREAGQPGVPQSVMQPPAQTQTTLTTGPMTTPGEVVGTQTNTLPDGTQQTTTSTGQATVTPSISGSGSNTSITYNYNYTITNVTQVPNGPPVTNTETIIIKLEPAPVPETSPTEFPKDYNKEATQQQILGLLRGDGMPDGSALSSEEAETQARAALASGQAVIDGMTPESVGLVSWLPDVPTAKCVNPTVTNPANGNQEEFNMCEPVDLFSKFISAVICVFVLYGCVREVQAAIAT